MRAARYAAILLTVIVLSSGGATPAVALLEGEEFLERTIEPADGERRGGAHMVERAQELRLFHSSSSTRSSE
ncbi:MAG: hypothetical protein HQ583_03920 [Candidatus Abyssubacteria bacterium]|nr:hypothetical protein [Candidatus Abyssubacteria bacterium]